MRASVAALVLLVIGCGSSGSGTNKQPPPEDDDTTGGAGAGGSGGNVGNVGNVGKKDAAASPGGNGGSTTAPDAASGGSGGSGATGGGGGTGGGGAAGTGGNAGGTTGKDAGADTQAADAGPVVPVSGKPFVYVGSGFYDLADPQLYAFRLDPDTGSLTQVQKTSADASPTFIAIAPGNRYLYLNIENSPTAAAAYKIDQTTGTLTKLNTVRDGYNGSAYITTDGTGKYVLQANYGSGWVTVIGVKADGSLGAVVDKHDLGGADANPHSVRVDPTNKFVFVMNRWNTSKAGNYIAQFKFDQATGILTPNDPAKVDLPIHTGPRHMAFHPNLPFVYVDNETNSTVSTYAYDSTKGTLTKVEDLSTVPAGVTGNAPADMRIHPSGKFLYVANRSQYSLAIFSIDGTTGKLTFVAHEKFAAGQPRNFVVDPNGKFLVVANIGGNSVMVFKIDGKTGLLTAIGTPASVASASGIDLAYLPGP